MDTFFFCYFHFQNENNEDDCNSYLQFQECDFHFHFRRPKLKKNPLLIPPFPPLPSSSPPHPPPAPSSSLPPLPFCFPSPKTWKISIPSSPIPSALYPPFFSPPFNKIWIISLEVGLEKGSGVGLGPSLKRARKAGQDKRGGKDKTDGEGEGGKRRRGEWRLENGN